ncbi:MAG: hypothetical protein CMD16_02085 [Flavobacteriales bacterium]|nr:hypothetical protein [Flavobacteriales bacterium]|tara:strand:+ start:87032 stop:88768 length:1737 start_codon:yes stop_codon:yes gene_type:complete
MKKLLLCIFTLAFLIGNAQTFVSTTPENKNALLEEFTGISCGYCPDGHLIASQIHDANPNDVAIIAIHAGGFASPQGAGTDFRTTEGTAIDSYWGVSGYPSGTVNRVGGDMGRSQWSGAATTVLGQSSPVNVAAQASVDMATNVLTVDVEVYYTGSQTVSSNQINVAVVQNNVEGPQSGMSGNPSNVLPNGNYNHQHMLRYMMTGTWGEQIANITQGAFFSQTYTWTMPADINGVALDATNLGVVAFVTEGNENVLSSTIEIAPNIIFVNQNDAYCMSSSANDAVCASATDIEVTFRNYGSANLTSLDINYSINGGAANTYPWTGNLIPAGTETITIPAVAFTPQATNTVDINTSNPNGVMDQNALNDQTTTSFSQFDVAGQVTPGIVAGQASIDIVCDAYGNETTWELTDDAGNIVASGGPYQGTGTAGTYPQPTVYANLNSNECYSFLIKDSYGDGMNTAQYGAGSFTVTDASGNAFITGGVFTSEVRESFKADGVASSVSNTENTTLYIYPNPVKDILTINGAYNSLEIYDIYGKLILASDAKETINVSTLASGIYIVNINSKSGIQTKKITVTK